MSIEWIEGIPKEVQKKPEHLHSFLQDTYVKVRPLSNSNYKIYVNHKIKGGAPGDNREIAGFNMQSLEMIREALEQANHARDKNIVVMLGPTGAGKSTAINGFLGCRMMLNRGVFPARIEVENENEEIAPMGHRNWHSETFFTKVYHEHQIPGTQLVFADAGGFQGTEEPGKKIALAISLKEVLKNAKSVRIILCIDSSGITVDRGRSFKEAMLTTFRDLIDIEPRINNSFILMITKPPSDVENAKEIIYRCLQEIRNEIGEEPQLNSLKNSLDFVLREDGRYVCVYDPMRAETAREALRILKQTQGVPKGTATYKIPYSGTSKPDITRIIKEISTIGKDLFSRQAQIISDIANLEQALPELTRMVERTQSLLESINRNVDVEIVQNERVAIIDIEIAGVRTSIEEARAKLRELRTSGESLVFQNDAIHKVIFNGTRPFSKEKTKRKIFQKKHPKRLHKTISNTKELETINGKDFERRTTKTKLYKSGKVIDSKKTTVKLELARQGTNFTYNGPKIAAYNLTPPKFSEWSKLSRNSPIGKTSFSFKYQPNDRPIDNPSVAIRIRKKDSPEHITEKSEYERELTRLYNRASQLRIQKESYDNFVVEARPQAENAQQNESLRQNLEEILASQRSQFETIQQSLTSKQTERQELAESLSENKDHFIFCRDYLELSEDAELSQLDVVRQFSEVVDQILTQIEE